MRARRQMQDYLDGRLSPRERAAFETALATDNALAADLHETERSLELLRDSLPSLHAPDGLSDRILAAVRAKPLPKRHWLPIDVLGGWAAPRRLGLATAVAAAAALTVFVSRPPEPPATAALPRVVNLSPSDEALVRQSLLDYHAAVMDRARHTPAALDDGWYDGSLGL